MTKTGKLYGIGVGPGDPELMTCKAVHILKTIPVVAVPCASPDRPSLALKTAQNALDPRAEVLKLHFAMVKEESVRAERRREAAVRIAAHLEAGKDVAFLSEGDVMLYSTFAYVLAHLAGRFPVEIVPGVSSVMSAAAAAGLPLAINDQRLVILPATHETLADLADVFTRYDTVVLLKVHAVIEKVVAILRALGRLEQAVLVEWASMETCRLLTDVAALKNGELSYMSQLIVSVNAGEFLR